jgi:hypothetical protein
MTKILIVKNLIIYGTIVFYFIFTIRYFLVFRKNIIFTGKIKAFHLVMMWLIPFIWILILKALTKSTPGSYQIEKKEVAIPFSDNDNDGIKASQIGF